MNCPLCKTPLSHEVDAYYYACSGCGAYVKEALYYIDSKDEKARYEEHNNDVNDPGYQNFTSPITQTVLKHYTPEHKGLDFGSGTGPVITHVLSKKNYNIRLYDPFFHPDKSYLEEKYDYIFSCEVFEHLKQPEKEISSLLKLLRPGGRLIIMTHIYDKTQPFENWYYRKDPTHIFIYTEETLRFIAKNYSLIIEEMTERLVVFCKGAH